VTVADDEGCVELDSVFPGFAAVKKRSYVLAFLLCGRSSVCHSLISVFQRPYAHALLLHSKFSIFVVNK